MTYFKIQPNGVVFVAVTALAQEAGHAADLVVVTADVWEDCVAWDADDNRRKGTIQDQDGRLWDVLWMAARIVAPRAGTVAPFDMVRTPRAGRARRPAPVRLSLRVERAEFGGRAHTIARDGDPGPGVVDAFYAASRFVVARDD